MNEAYNNLLTRRSVRKYSQQAVAKEMIEKICLAGSFAPTGKNSQSPIILAITNKEVRDRLARLNCEVVGKSTEVDAFYGAPVVLAVLAKKDASTHVYDGSCVMSNLMNAANSLGIGSCWIHRAKEVFETEEGKKILLDLGITDEYEGIGNCILGYPVDNVCPKERKDNWVYFIE